MGTRVELTTSKGVITVELEDTAAPISTANFLSYADRGAFAGTIFHRVIEGFMVQGGGLDENLRQKPTEAAIKNEWKNGLSNARGTLAMARLGGRADSATSQFFINLADNDFLDQPRDGAGYAVFAKVVGGMDVVDQIAKVRTVSRGGHDDVPAEPVRIESVRRVASGG